MQPGRWDPTIREALERLAVDRAGGLAVFDFDGTLVDGDVGELLAAKLDRRILKDVERHRKKGDEYLARRRLLIWLERMGEAPTDHAEDLFAEELHVEPELVELITLLRANGWLIRIVADTHVDLVRAVCHRAGVAPDEVIGAVPGANWFPWGTGKLQALEYYVGRRATLAVGDGLGDLALLKAAVHGLVIDRGEPELHKPEFWVQPLK